MPCAALSTAASTWARISSSTGRSSSTSPTPTTGSCARPSRSTSPRELIADARDYHQAKIAQDQNEIVKKLAVVASLVLIPTFLVGVYGQNFEHMPELGWRFGYAFSWGVIALITIGQLAFFRRKKWI